jgi:hypothetical protein
MHLRPHNIFLIQFRVTEDDKQNNVRKYLEKMLAFFKKNKEIIPNSLLK